ncbi:MAG: S-layer homology domain-containing protein [Thermoleophilia bacterium]|nr:S-layer homology domain-containing protein [Thermoleophilia bacterium]
MKEQTSTARVSRRKKLLVLCGAVILVITLAVLMSGCVQISNVNLNSGTDAGSNHQITMTLTAQSDATNAVRGVFGIRIPAFWDVKSVTFAGTLTGAATRSTVMEGVFATDWEATAPDAGYNGPKPGYKWWVGYSGASTWVTGNTSTVTILLDTHGRGGTYMLDLVTGLANETNPEDLASKGTWAIGSAGTAPGALLDQAITLYSFTDVHPGAEYYDAIQGMAAKGLISGYPTSGGYSEFRPSNSVFRAQFAKMIDGALGLVVNEAMAAPVNFSDLGADDPADLYPHEYVWVAYTNNIIKGYTDGSFRPYTPIIRGHVLTMTVRAMQAMHAAKLATPPDSFVQTWGNDLPAEHKANARIAEYNNLLLGLPLSTTASNANAGMPRGEVAQVLWNMMNLITGP